MIDMISGQRHLHVRYPGNGVAQIRTGKALERKTTPSAPCLNQPNPYDWLDHSHALEVP